SRRRDGRFGFPLRAQQALIIGPDRAGGELERLHDLDENPLQRIHLSQRLPAGPTPPCVVRPPELWVLGTSPAYAASSWLERKRVIGPISASSISAPNGPT